MCIGSRSEVVVVSLIDFPERGGVVAVRLVAGCWPVSAAVSCFENSLLPRVVKAFPPPTTTISSAAQNDDGRVFLTEADSRAN
jgi:hypothetical protein